MWDWLKQLLGTFGGSNPIAGPALPGTTPAAGMPGGPGAPGLFSGQTLSKGLGYLNQAGQGAQDIGQISSLFNQQKPLMQTPPLAQPGPSTPFQSSPISGGANAGGGSIMDLIRMLMQSAR